MKIKNSGILLGIAIFIAINLLLVLNLVPLCK